MTNPGKIQAPSGSQFLFKGLCGACMRNRETPAGFKRKGWSVRRWRAAETASSKPLKAKQNHGKPWQDSSLKRKPIPPQRVVSSRIQALTGCRNCSFETVKIHSWLRMRKGRTPSKSEPETALALFFPYASPSGKAEGSADRRSR